MAVNTSEVKVPLVINKMSKKIYTDLSAAGQLSPNELYFVSGDTVDAEGKRVENVQDPVSGSDAATKKYVDEHSGVIKKDEFGFYFEVTTEEGIN